MNTSPLESNLQIDSVKNLIDLYNDKIISISELVPILNHMSCNS